MTAWMGTSSKRTALDALCRGAARSMPCTASCSSGRPATAVRSFTSLNQDTPFQLCFLRHGQSTWNRDNRFIGWTDTPLTDDGVLEARVAGRMLAQSGMRFDEVHTSLLRRSIRTANLVLMELGQEYIPLYKHWRLNERSYGSLVGKNKKEAVREHGADQVKRWRRSYDEPPPPMEDNHPYHPGLDPRYRAIFDQIPKCESLKDTVARSSVYWNDVIAPALHSGKTVMIVGHENNLRSLIMKLEDIAPADIINLNLPRAVPLAYRLDPVTLKPLDRADGKLDEATGMLRGEWLGGDQAVSQILERDDKQVYDTAITENLELGECRDKRNLWMSFVVGQASPEAKAKGCGHASSTFPGNVPSPLPPPPAKLQHVSHDRIKEELSFSRNQPPVPGIDKDPFYQKHPQLATKSKTMHINGTFTNTKEARMESSQRTASAA